MSKIKEMATKKMGEDGFQAFLDQQMEGVKDGNNH